MDDFRGKVAVITGGASGIGYALAEHCAQEGMKVVLADVEKPALLEAQHKLRSAGADVIASLTDVSDLSDVQSLARKTLDEFGGVHLVFNNAGVGGELVSIWKHPLEDWHWVMGVNFWGVVHGIQVFVPIMLEQESPCHIVNTASLAGVTSGPGLGAYKTSKHAVVSLSETLYFELARKGDQVGVSVLCPHWVSTNITESERNRPFRLSNPSASSGSRNKAHEEFRRAVKAGMSPPEVALKVFAAIREKKFYIFTHLEMKELIRLRMEEMLEERNPTYPPGL